MKKKVMRLLYAMMISCLLMMPAAAMAEPVETPAQTESVVETEEAVEEISAEESGEALEETTAEESEEAQEETQAPVIDPAGETESTEETTTAAEETTEAAPEILDGLLMTDGKLYLYKDGEKVTGLQTVEDEIYYFDETAEGAAFTEGAKEVDGNLYYFQKDGIAVISKFLEYTRDGETWRSYFRYNGQAGKAVYAFITDRYKLDAEGNVVLNSTGTKYRYYFQKDGNVFTGGYLQFVHANGKTYKMFFNTDGTGASGYKAAKIKYIADAAGNMTTETASGHYRMYLDQNGIAFNQGLLEFKYGGKTWYYYFENGVGTFKGFLCSTTLYTANASTHEISVKEKRSTYKYYYIDEKGCAVTNKLLDFTNQANGKKYTFFFQMDGSAFTKGFKTIKCRYQASTAGKISDALHSNIYSYYFQNFGGAYCQGFLKCPDANGNVHNYYFQTNGACVISKWMQPTRMYSADKNGNLTNIGDGDPHWYYFNSKAWGTQGEGWMTQDGVWAYFEDGERLFRNDYMHKAYERIKDKSSSTRYYVVVDYEECWVFTFKGSSGNWKPYFCWRCSPGAYDTPTVKGYFTITGRGYSFSGVEDYTCYYYTQFYGNYLFHSILYYKGTHTVRNGTLGEHLSHGCVRLATENAKWFYDNLPYGTRVYIY